MGNGHGGYRPGSGRKPLSEELRTRDLARRALINKYGSEEKAIEALLATGEPTLIKWAYDHAFGKPPDKLDLGDPNKTKIIMIGYQANDEDLLLPESTEDTEDIDHEIIDNGNDDNDAPSFEIEFQP